MKQHTKSLFIFHRDLRTADNRGLIRALSQSTQVIPCFIFDPAQVENENSYKSTNCIQFMITSLQELDEQLCKREGKLFLFYGNTHNVIKEIIKQEKIDAIYCNRDYTPFAINRDKSIEKLCHTNKIDFIQEHDLLLHEPEQVLSRNNTPYSIFTAFYKKALTFPVGKPLPPVHGTFYTNSIKGNSHKNLYKKILPQLNPNLRVKGGRSEAVTILKDIKDYHDYAQTRDYPALDSTTRLSAHLKFGTVSIREVYWHIADQLGASHPLLRQLYWRDFFTHVAYHSPFVFGQPFHEKYKKLPWKNDIKDFKTWCMGKTGFPIVDAGMRQLNATGWMHNRVRMIVASFLIKDLHIDWRWGEKYFAQQLVDYDPCVNNGNWQWCASTGCDAQPYFRIFNPWLQQKKFDKECEYIKKWVPELKHLNAKEIHNLNKTKQIVKNYPRPIVDHTKESSKATLLYKHI
ncbi:MAG: deoxyribodipyrimidine photo-lyase [Candidatus Babeliales bacterium]